MLLHAGEALQLEFDDRLRLFFAEFETPDQAFARLPGCALAARINCDDFVEIVERLLKAKQDMFAVAGFTQQVIGAAADHIGAMLDEALNDIDQAKLSRLAIDDAQHDHAEIHLHLRVLIQIIQDNFGLFAALQLNDNAHAVAIALVTNVGDAFDSLLAQPAPRFVQSALTYSPGREFR